MPTAGNLTPTITRDLRGTFILPAPNHLDLKGFFQSTDDVSGFRKREVVLDFADRVFDMSRALR